MSITLAPIKPFHPQFNPDPAWVRMGLTPEGHQLFKETTKRSRAVPDIDPKTSEQRWKLHPTTGEPLYPKNKPEMYDNVRVFYLESEGNGNIIKIDWSEPTADEVAAVQREKGIKELIPKLSETLYDADINLADLVSAMKMISQATKGELPDEAPPAESAAPEPVLAPMPEPVLDEVDDAGDLDARSEAKEEDEDLGPPPPSPKIGVDFPFSIRPGGHWRLSDGSEYTGKKVDAQAAETALQEAAAVP